MILKLNYLIRLASTLVVLLFSLTVAGCGGSQGTSSQAIALPTPVNGLLVDTAGTPISGAQILVLDKNGASTTTSSAGTFLLNPSVITGQLLLQITLSGTSYDVSFNLPAPTVELQFDAAGGTVSVIASGQLGATPGASK